MEFEDGDYLAFLRDTGTGFEGLVRKVILFLGCGGSFAGDVRFCLVGNFARTNKLSWCVRQNLHSIFFIQSNLFFFSLHQMCYRPHRHKRLHRLIIRITKNTKIWRHFWIIGVSPFLVIFSLMRFSASFPLKSWRLVRRHLRKHELQLLLLLQKLWDIRLNSIRQFPLCLDYICSRLFDLLRPCRSWGSLDWRRVTWLHRKPIFGVCQLHTVLLNTESLLNCRIYVKTGLLFGFGRILLWPLASHLRLVVLDRLTGLDPAPRRVVVQLLGGD